MEAAIAPPPPLPPPAELTLEALVTSVRGLLESLDAPPAPVASPLVPSPLPAAVLEEVPFTLIRSAAPAIQADRSRTAPPEDGAGSMMAVCALSGRRYHMGCLNSHEQLQAIFCTHQP